MTINMDWGSLNINVPRTEMLLIQTVPVEVRQLDLTEFRYAMHDEQDSDAGMAYLHMHEHNPPVLVAGVTLAQVVTIVNGYTVTFEDGLYNVNIVGGNSNVADNVIKNTVGVNTANSAGLQDSTSLQAASFGGEVVVDVLRGFVGTVFPIGTRRIPAINLQDAVVVANREGIDVIRFHSDFTLKIGDIVNEFILKGQNAVLTKLDIEPGAEVLNCQISDATISGTLDGGTLLERAQTDGINYVNGIIYNTSLNKTPIILGGNDQAMFLNCSSSVSGSDTPTIDMGGSGQSLAVRNYSGGLKLINRTGTDPVSIDMASGHVIIDSTCTAGIITIRGSYKLTDNSGTGCIVDTVGRNALTSTTIDANIVSVNETPTTAISDFFTDLSGVAADVWTYAGRTLTQTIFDSNIIEVNGVTVTSIDEFKTDPVVFDSNVNITSVGGVAVTSPDDLKADVSNLSADVNVVEVNGVVVNSIDEFKADLTGIDLSTIPQAVWTYVERELTVAAGLTPAQEAKLDEIIVDISEVPTSGENATAVWEYVVPDITDPDLIEPLFPQGR